MKRIQALLLKAITALLALLLMIELANAFIVRGEEMNTCADWLSNTNNENEFRYQWMLGFVHGAETTLYPDRKDSKAWRANNLPGIKRNQSANSQRGIYKRHRKSLQGSSGLSFK